MQPSTVERLLRLNRRFYATVAPHFDATRQGWTQGLLAIVPYIQAASKESPLDWRDGVPIHRRSLRVLDAGCANGRLARLLANQGVRCQYTGVDADSSLLDSARAATAELSGVTCCFLLADLADSGWAAQFADASFDVIVCTATMQHLPGYDLRLRLLQEFCRLRRTLVIVSYWQFLTSQRLAQRQIPWSTVGLRADQVEPGDALLPWKQGVDAVRYVHQVDEREACLLAEEAGLSVSHTFRADGREGNLNLYAIMH